MARLRVVRGDITALAVDAIANATNSSLLGGAGEQLYRRVLDDTRL